MGGGLILETSFLIDLERERRRERRGPAFEFLARRSVERLCVTVTTAGELACGVAPAEREAWEDLVRGFAILPIDLAACWEYGRAFQYLKENGLLIGSNDLWIAAVALARELPLVTRNDRHFRRVPGLQVLGYADSNAAN